MPNETTNYKLKKPLPEEFYDIGVHNANMDTIDAELKRKYDPNNKPTAADVGAVSNNGGTVNGALKTYGGSEGATLSSERDYNGDKYTADVGVFPEGNPYIGRRKNGTLESYVILEDKKLKFNSEVGGIYSEVLHTGNYGDYAVSKSGGTMTGNLKINKATGAYVALSETDLNNEAILQSYNGKMSMYVRKENQSERWVRSLTLCNHAVEEYATNALYLYDKHMPNGTETRYTILHTGNSNMTRLVSTETTPTVNNEINWTYK